MQLKKWLQTQAVLDYLEGAEERPADFDRILITYGGDQREALSTQEALPTREAREAGLSGGEEIFPRDFFPTQEARSARLLGGESLSGGEDWHFLLHHKRLCRELCERAHFCLDLIEGRLPHIPTHHVLVQEVRALEPSDLLGIEPFPEHRLLFYAFIAKVRYPKQDCLRLAEHLLSCMDDAGEKWKDGKVHLFRKFLKIWRKKSLQSWDFVGLANGQQPGLHQE